jgi:FkbM family methyltransferase
MKRIIYDFGSNNGDDIPYYLLRADLVVAVEANPKLCDQIRSRFTREIEEKRLAVECCVINSTEPGEDVRFYIHEIHDVLSQFPKPDQAVISEFRMVYLPSKTAPQLIAKYGKAFYIKIDIEHYDVEILKSLFDNNIRPPYLSAEYHCPEVFTLMCDEGGYGAFKLVEGRSVSSVYANQILQNKERKVRYSFPFHSAGPFGADIAGRWIGAESFSTVLLFEKPGWKDIHATTLPESAPVRFSSIKSILLYVKIKKIARLIKQIRSRVRLLLKNLSIT